MKKISRNAKQCIAEYKNTKRNFESKMNNLKKVINSTEQIMKVKINGSIKPHESYISMQDLYKFYEKNGFIEEGKLLKRISCSTDKI